MNFAMPLAALRFLKSWGLASLALYVGMRLAAVHFTASSITRPALDVAGLYGDVLAAAATAALLLIAYCVRPWLAGGLLALLLLLTFANLEHIYALDDALRLGVVQFATDFYLVAGTVFGAYSWPFALIATTAAIALWIRQKKQGNISSAAGLAAALALLLVSTVLLWQHARNALSWRETNPLALMVVQAVGDNRPAEQEVSGQTIARAASYFKQELSEGALLENVTRQQSSQPNILVVMIEGIPGAYLSQVQQLTGFRPGITMPRLSRFASQALLVPDFVVHAEGTIRGSYALMCGDYNNYSTGILKASNYVALAKSDRVPCLPKILADEGYQTSYHQAANLAFSSKNEIMPALGFADVNQAVVSEAEGTFWGVNDAGFFESARREIGRLEQGGQPWFLTLLNVGTHHPFSAPEQYSAQYETRKEAAIAFLDDQLAGLLDDLERSGVLEDTLVVVVSDESHGVPGHEFSNDWGTLLLAGPGIEPGLNQGLFGQVDVALSILDYLDIATKGEQFLGRSVIRKYKQPRQMVFGEFITTGAGEAVTCSIDHCRTISSGNSMLLAGSYNSAALPGKQAADVEQLFWQTRRLRQLFHGREAAQSLLLSIQRQKLKGQGRASLSDQVEISDGRFFNVVLELRNDAPVAVDLLWLWRNEHSENLFELFEPRLGSLAPGGSLRLMMHFGSPERAGVWNLSLLAVASQGLIDLEVSRLEILSAAAEGQRQPFRYEAFASIPPSLTDNWRFPDGSAIYRNAALPTASDAETDGRSDYENTSRGFLPIARYRLGETILFNDSGPWYGKLYLGFDWSYPDRWGVWSDGEKPQLVFHLDNVDPAIEYELSLGFLPYLQPPFLNEQQLTFYLNGTKLGSSTYAKSEVEKIGIEIPGSLLNRDGINTVTLEVGSVFIPALYNAGPDHTALGVGIIEFAIKPKST